jgi:DNA polymerase-1
MYLDYNNRYWAIDIEGDGLLEDVTRVWCVCAANIVTGEEVTLTDYKSIKDWFSARRKERAKFVGHNIIGYDARVLNVLLDCGLTVAELVDTLVLSMVYSPSFDGGHGLENWGNKLNFPKGDFNDFSALTPEMIEYCMNDTRLCRKIYLALAKRMKKVGFTDTGIEIEHRSWSLVKKQQRNGFHFNVKEAHCLYALLREKENEIRDRIYEYWPPELQIVARYKQARKKDGSSPSNFERHKEQFVKVEELNDGGYVAWDYVAFNLASPDQRRQKLLDLGWEPLEFTKPSKTHPQGQAKATDKGELVPSLKAFVEESGKKEVELIAKWIDINARGNMVNTWIEAHNEKTGCIHGSLWYANTLRYTHSNPNTANIPAVRVFERKDDSGKVVEKYPLKGEDGAYTYEARDLWTARDPSRRLVGVDAKGIQLRVLAHYLNNPQFTEAVLAGDPHSYNQEIGGFRSRAVAKTFIYAFLLGAGDGQVGKIIGGSTRDGRDVKKRFVGNFPGLSDLLDNLERQIKRTGRIVLCDGTPIIVSAPHTRLGYLLQGDESRIMKKAAILSDLAINLRKLDVLKVGDIHDEWQNDVFKDHVEELTDDIYPLCFKRSGEFFNYNLPIDCDTKVGFTWAETH